MSWKSRLTDPTPLAPKGFKSLSTPVYRGSTILFDRQRDVFDDWRHNEHGYSYGVFGTPTALELAARIAQLEKSKHTFLTPSGQSAIALVYLSFCRSGDHVLIPDNVYGPSRDMALDLLAGLGIEVEIYPSQTGAEIEGRIRSTTKLIWCESPGSLTMEVQDVPGIVKAAARHYVPVALDNTYSAGVFFDAFGHGASVSVQALSKFVGGHSDVLLGSVSVCDERSYESVGRAFGHLGMSVSPDECSLALRGLQTLSVRLDRLKQSALKIACELQNRPYVKAVLHPALPTCPGHDIWKRDFTGSTSVFSVLFDATVTSSQIETLIDSMKLFKIGFSWGGVTSLAVAFPMVRSKANGTDNLLVRFNIGLEDPDDLLHDLDHALCAAGIEANQ